MRSRTISSDQRSPNLSREMLTGQPDRCFDLGLPCTPKTVSKVACELQVSVEGRVSGRKRPLFQWGERRQMPKETNERLLRLLSRSLCSRFQFIRRFEQSVHVRRVQFVERRFILAFSNVMIPGFGDQDVLSALAVIRDNGDIDSWSGKTGLHELGGCKITHFG